jgi:2,4-didehydro-3-deoxy-L-rhamnonate hydrolase
MKILRYGAAGAEKPGVLDKQGHIRDLSNIISDISRETLANGALAKLKGVDIESLPLVNGNPRIGSVVAGTHNFIAVGLNYSDHAAETGATVPPEPILFNKAPSCIQGPNDDIMIPKGSEKTDWEVELCIVIGKRGRYIAKADVNDYIAGYCVCNDISERAYQTERSGQWMKGKGCETFGPVGPYLVTPDEIKDVQNLKMTLDVNGKSMQNGSSNTMVYDCAFLVSYISQFMVLEPGDMITTGTPPGVGLGMKPPMYLKAGDTMRVEIEGLGVQNQKVIGWK